MLVFPNSQYPDVSSSVQVYLVQDQPWYAFMNDQGANEAKPLWKRWWVWIVGLLLLIWIGTRGNETPETTTESAGLKVGDTVEVVGPETGMILLALTEEMLDQKRSGSGEQLEPGADFFGVSPSEEAKILTIHDDKVQVQILDGNWADRAGWIATEEVRPKPTQEQLASNLKFGLTLGERRRLYGELHRVGMFATYEARYRVPISASGDELEEHRKVYEDTKAQGREEVVSKYGIIEATLDSVDAEGNRKRWPLPDVPDPYE